MIALGNVRRLSLLLSASLLGAALALGWIGARPEMSGDAADQIRRADDYFDALIARTRTPALAKKVDTATAVSLGYLERLRLGLGSPFRLAEFALRDPRLSDSTARRVAWAVFGRLRRGDAYVVDRSVATGLGPSSDALVSGEAHLRLIEHALTSASDPRAGELTVRLAYSLAAGERTIADRGDVVATEIAALVRDRMLAQEDLRELLRDARTEGVDPLLELQRRRRARELRVERPSAEPMGADLQMEAIRAVPALLAKIRDLGDDTVRAIGDARAVATSGDPERATLLTPAVATLLANLGDLGPAQAPVAVTLRSHRDILADTSLSADVRAARDRFVSRSGNEETLAGEYARLMASGDTAHRPSALAMLATATALRAFAQEPVWFPGMPAPSVFDLRNEYGLANVTFGADVPEAWRPYYLRMVETSLADMRRVLGGLSLDGLRVHLGAAGLPDTVLALHDPKTRTIRLSIFSSAGTLAHELAHDLDWQAARRLYSSGGYSSDRAVREQRGSLAASMRDLTSARMVTRRGVLQTAERPAEVFARDVDWLVAVSLAREGRSNGYLSAVQDAALTGYTTVSPVAMIFGAARPLVDAVQEMTYLAAPVREGFLERWGDARAIDPYLIVRRVLEAPLGRRRLSGPQRLFLDAEPKLSTGEAHLCSASGPPWAPELRLRQELLDLTLDVRARGVARMRARFYPDATRPGWARSILGNAPWAPEEGEAMVRRIRGSLAAQIESNAPGDQTLMPTPSIFWTSEPSCSTSAF